MPNGNRAEKNTILQHFTLFSIPNDVSGEMGYIYYFKRRKLFHCIISMLAHYYD